MSNNFYKGTQRVDAATEIKKTLLIVKAQSQSLTAVENFLRNREWKLFSTTSLKDALTYMIQNQPAFVMISVDHPNKKVRNLAKVLTQAFPCCVIMFAEQSAPASFKMLSDSKAEYLLYPPVTGPAVERTVNKYYKDQTARPASHERGPGLNGEDGDKTISIKGGGVSAQSLMAQLLGEEGGGGFVAGGEGSASPEPSFLGGASSAKDASDSGNYDPSHVGHYNPQVGDGQIAPTHHNAQDPKLLDPTHYNGQTNGAPDTRPPGAEGQGGSDRPNGADTDPTAARPGKASSNDFDSHSGANSHGGWRAVEKPEKQRPGAPLDDELNIGASKNSDSIILKGTKEALDKSVIRGRHAPEEVQQIQDSSNVACIVIESTRFSGYLVAAMGKNRRIDDEFIDRIREKLFKFLNDNGEQVEGNDNMQLKIKQVPFEDWAVECAEFLRKSVHKGDEVAMAFFPHPDVKAKFEDSASDEMVAVSLEDLEADKAVEFNLYVYLPANKKYVLYTPRGGKLYANQKDKLTRQGVSHMHMLKEEVQDFNKYRAQNYLNGKIEEFENRQKITKAAV